MFSDLSATFWLLAALCVMGAIAYVCGRIAERKRNDMKKFIVSRIYTWLIKDVGGSNAHKRAQQLMDDAFCSLPTDRMNARTVIGSLLRSELNGCEAGKEEATAKKLCKAAKKLGLEIGHVGISSASIRSL